MDNSFFQNFLAGAQLADREHEMQQQAEEHKLIVQQHKLALDTAKLEQAKHLRELQAMQSGGPITQPPNFTPDTRIAPPQTPELDQAMNSQFGEAAPTMADILTKIRQQPVQPIGDQNQPIMPLPGPNIPINLSTGMVTIPGTNKEMTDQEAARRAQAELAAKLALEHFVLKPEERAVSGTGKVLAQGGPAKPEKKPDYTINGTRFSGETNQPLVTGPSNPATVTPHTVTTEQGVFQWNPETQKFDIRIGDRPKTAASMVVQPSAGGLDLMAEQALNGQFTSRNPQLLGKVYTRASEIAKERGLDAQSVLLEQNAAKANREALNKLTAQNAQVEAFSDTARKNMQILQQKVDAIGGDSPWLNRPVRAIQAQRGDPKLSAFYAALLPAQTDIAKILNSANATGVLTNEAREDMQKALGADATPAQIRSALHVFEQDMQNRKDSYASQLEELKQRTVVGNKTPAGGGSKADPLGIR